MKAQQRPSLVDITPAVTFIFLSLGLNCRTCSLYPHVDGANVFLVDIDLAILLSSWQAIYIMLSMSGSPLLCPRALVSLLEGLALFSFFRSIRFLY